MPALASEHAMKSTTDALAEAFPLQWPLSKPRTPASHRERARFSVQRTQTSFNGASSWKRKGDLSVAAARSRLHHELELLKANGIVVSSNMPLRKDGLPMSGRSEPADPGVAVYCFIGNAPRVFASDKYDRVPDNLAAIAAHLEALRGQLRWGVGDLEQAFAGYKALPAMDAKRPWWVVLGFLQPPVTLDVAKTKYLELMGRQHPDAGGNANQAAETSAAFQEAKAFYAR